MCSQHTTASHQRKQQTVPFCSLLPDIAKARDSLLHESLDEPIPGGAKWVYIFGSGLLFLFVSQVITGVFLALYYVPSADHAHTVVSYIVKEVTSGSFVRSIHAYGSSGIIIMLLP